MPSESIASSLPELKRRTVIAALAGAAVSCRGTRSGELRFFTEAEARIVEAITAQLIPADQDPGAKEAGVVHYIDIQLATRFRKHRRTYREALARFPQDFAGLPDAKQIEILNEVEEHEKAFFNLILTHTRQGFYGDPRHGGNRQMASWKMLRLATPPIRGRFTEQT